MKHLITLLFLSLLFSAQSSFAQEVQVPQDSVAISAAAEVEKMVMEKQIEEAEKAAKKAEKKAKKAEKAQKKSEKAAKKANKLAGAIVSKKKDISKEEQKIIKTQEKLNLGKVKGKFSPDEVQKLNSKIDKMKLSVLKNKERLRKLERKQ